MGQHYRLCVDFDGIGAVHLGFSWRSGAPWVRFGGGQIGRHATYAFALLLLPTHTHIDATSRTPVLETKRPFGGL